MRRVLILAVVFVALVGIMIVQRQQQKRVVASAPVEVLSVDPQRATRMRIEKPGEEPVELVRSAGSWKLDEPLKYRANDQIVSSVLKTLESLELEDVVSTNPEKRGTFQVDSTGTRVEVWESDESVLSIVVGKSSPDWSHTYVRPTDQDKVYRAVGVLTYNFNKRVDDWRDKTILSIDQPSISRVKLEYPKEKMDVVLSRADTLWTFAVRGGDPEVADSLTVAQLLRNTSKLSTVSFASEEDVKDLDFSTPDFRLQVETDAETQTVQFVEGEGNKLFAILEGEHDIVFQLNKGNLANVMKKPEDLRPKGS